jgi:DNA-binding NtrC family response regulator
MLSPDLLTALDQHDWNGNVRELANALEHAIILSDGKVLRREDLPASVLTRGRKRPAPASQTVPLADGKAHGDRPKSLREIEMEAIYESLERNGGDKPKTAQELGIALKTLYNKLNQSSAHAEAG